MKIVFIGAGNLATNVAKALHEAGHEILQVFSRTMASAEALAGAVGAVATDDVSAVAGNADIYILSVKDAVLKSVIEKLCDGKRKGLFVHTAGSIPMDVFEGHAERYGVFYPMQSFSKQRQVDFSDVSMFVEAKRKEDLDMLFRLGRSLGPNVVELSSEGRKRLHLAAVFACNFTNHCYHLAEKVLSEYDIPFDVMLPLVDETARKVHEVSPMEAQTGPAVRYDENVINMQRDMLPEGSGIQQIYELMSKDIHESRK